MTLRAFASGSKRAAVRTTDYNSRLAAPVRSVLFVCTGNICRSPYAELLLQHLVPDINTASAGTHALIGHAMDPLMGAELSARGIDPSRAVGTGIGASALEADLVLVMSRRQRRFLIEEHPASVRRVGLLGAIDELAAMVPDSHVLQRSHVTEWSRHPVSAQCEIDDPYRRGAGAASLAATRLDASVTRLAKVLGSLAGSAVRRS